MPGESSPTRCYPMVIFRNCKLGLHHSPVLLVELALAAWGVKAEDTIFNHCFHILACNLGPMEMTCAAHIVTKRACLRDILIKGLQHARPSLAWPDTIEAWVGTPDQGITRLANRAAPATDWKAWGSPDWPDWQQIGSAWDGAPAEPETDWNAAAHGRQTGCNSSSSSMDQ